MAKPKTPAPERFWPKVHKTETCWLWTAAVDRDGYGRFGVEAGDVRYAHRYAYELLREPVPTDLHVDHLCRVRACVNPDHLEPVTPAVNVLRSDGLTARQARQTHCSEGHELPPYQPGEKRHCRPCNNAWQRRRKAARRNSEVAACSFSA